MSGELFSAPDKEIIIDYFQFLYYPGPFDNIPLSRKDDNTGKGLLRDISEHY
jgi:hypothetical protein